ncbi:MAG: chorismate mutase [Candidatus Marinimicrobia bacterium]|nr:chorismate mutase [Candidatus Neomarinimicrobiota bacterium]
MNTIKKLRNRIDAIDKKIIKLLDERMENAYKIGKYKGENDLQIIVSNREEEIYDSLKTIQTGYLSEQEILHLYKEIIKIGRKHGLEGKEKVEKEEKGI